MAYSRNTWVCGDVISAQKLNNMEDGIEEALECCGGDAGYSCGESYELLTQESVTTIYDQGFNDGVLSYSQGIDADTIRVTFNGTEYECSVVQGSDTFSYGAEYDPNTDTVDWSQYPFIIASLPTEGVNSITTETAGTYQIKIEAASTTVETSECFEQAVESITSPFVLYVDATTEATPVITVKKFDADVVAALASGEILERSGVAYVDEGDISLMLPLRNISVNEHYGWCELTFSGLDCTFRGDGTISSIFCKSVYAKIDMSDGSLVESHYSGVQLYQA